MDNTNAKVCIVCMNLGDQVNLKLVLCTDQYGLSQEDYTK